jgi:dipeptidase E
MGTLILMGAGGYTLEPESEVLDRVFLSYIHKPRPHICLLPTASGDRQETIDQFHAKFQEYGAQTSHISLFMPEIDDIDEYLLKADGIYITGGNTKSMLALWREWSVDNALIKAYEANIPIAGISAGALCFYEEGLTDSLSTGYCKIRGLGIIKGSFCPHYYSGTQRASSYENAISSGDLKAGIGLGDGVALTYEEGVLTQIVKSRNSALCEFVYKGGKTEACRQC